MPKKIVRVPYCVWASITIETDSDDDDAIIDEALSSFGGLRGYAGNGARHGKLIGTSESHVVLEEEEENVEGAREFRIEVVDAE